MTSVGDFVLRNVPGCYQCQDIFPNPYKRTYILVLEQISETYWHELNKTFIDTSLTWRIVMDTQRAHTVMHRVDMRSGQDMEKICGNV
jgi:hypothetical protein